MLITGTAYDLYLEKKKKKRSQNKTSVNYSAYEVEPVHVKLDMGSASGVKNKGKSAVYVVNNNNNVPAQESSAETSSIESQDENPGNAIVG